VDHLGRPGRDTLQHNRGLRLLLLLVVGHLRVSRVPLRIRIHFAVRPPLRTLLRQLRAGHRLLRPQRTSRLPTRPAILPLRRLLLRSRRARGTNPHLLARVDVLGHPISLPARSLPRRR